MSDAWLQYFLAAAAVFLLVAAASKLIAGSSLRTFLVAVGMPPALATFCARTVAPLEMLLGVGLLIQPLSVWAACFALPLAVLFVALQVRAVARGAHCACYGNWDPPEARISLARALTFLATLVSALTLAGVGLSQQGPVSVATILGAASAAAALLAFALVAQVIWFAQARTRFVQGAVIFGRG
jgi:hypothetical protein